MRDEPINESTLQVAVIDAAHAFGWMVAHFRPARTERGWRTPVSADGKGFFDLVLVNWKQKRVIFAELKGKRGKQTPEQKTWFEATLPIAEVSSAVDVVLWTPADWPERVMELLAPPR